MLYSDVKRILDRIIFEEEKQYIIKKLALSPERYIGAFRPTKPKAKLIQNLFQSREIRFGDAIEVILRNIISQMGFTNLDCELSTVNYNLPVDQYFTDGKYFYFVEQKIRDDHDSSKKYGQIDNFIKKLDVLYERHQKDLIGIMYFVDPTLAKNKNFYAQKLEELNKKYHINLFLFYGEEFFIFFNHLPTWIKLLDWISQWKDDLPDFPEINFDLSPEESFEDIKSIEPRYWKRIIENDDIWNSGIIKEIFNTGTTLKLLFGYFSQQENPIYEDLAKSLLEKINIYYYAKRQTPIR